MQSHVDNGTGEVRWYHGQISVLIAYGSKGGFLFNRKLRSLYKPKRSAGMRTRAKQKIVAKATAPGARVPRAELFIHSGERPDLSAVLRKEKRRWEFTKNCRRED